MTGKVIQVEHSFVQCLAHLQQSKQTNSNKEDSCYSAIATEIDKRIQESGCLFALVVLFIY